MILALTKEGDLVVDPFIGAGTTAVAAILRSRRVAGADMVPEYINLAGKRIKQAARGALPFRPRTKPVYVLAADTPLRTMPEEFIRRRA